VAEHQDPSAKTEEPTAKRLDEAQKKGNVARSIEINHWFMILSGAVALLVFGESVGNKLTALFVPFLASPDRLAEDAQGLVPVLGGLAVEVLLALLPLFLLFLAFAAGAGLVQNKPGVSWAKIAPDPSRLSLVGGCKRLFSVQSLLEFGKSLFKVAIVAAVGLILIKPEIETLAGLIAGDPALLPGRMSHLVLVLMGGVIAVMSLVAGGDLLYQRLAHHRRLRMTRHEIREELRQTEGDPGVKARLRSLRLERARKRMMAAVPTADVVVTNPSHYAVALKYEPEEMAAPKVVAKGADTVAFRIREVAENNRVPVVENPPLARALYAVDLDREVPVELYRAVAEVIGYVMRLKGKLAPQKPAHLRSAGRPA
jgi:flagellar biosynthetic protein FlhB